METELRDALIAWQGGELPAGRAEALLGRLREDAEFRRAFATEVWTLSLTRIAQAPDPRWLALHEELGLSETTEDALSEETFESAVMHSIRQEPVRFVAAWWRWAAYTAMAAALVLGLGLVLWSKPTPKLVSKPDAKAQMLAVLIQSADAVWKGDAPHASAGTNPVGSDHLQLVSGRARLMFTSGAILDFEGPADLQVLSVDRVVCREGRLRTNVPHGAEGFCVETPHGTVTDLGTELGVSVSPDGKTNVAVFAGQAEVSLQIPGQEGVRTALLNVRDTAEMLPRTGEIRTESSGDFLTASKLRFPELPLESHYSDVIRATAPLQYWRLDRVQEGAIPNEVSGAPPLRVAGGAKIDTDEFGRMSGYFPGKSAPGALYLDEPWSKPATSYAVEIWFATDDLKQMSVVALTAAEAHRRHVALVELGSRRPGRGAEAGVVRYLMRWPAGDRGGMNIYSPPTALPYEWHHLVAQQSEGDLQLYLDGSSVGTARAESFPQAVQCALQFGGLEFHAGDDPAKIERPFSGRLAEVAIYGRLLTPSEIRQHAALGGKR